MNRLQKSQVNKISSFLYFSHPIIFAWVPSLSYKWNITPVEQEALSRAQLSRSERSYSGLYPSLMRYINNLYSRIDGDYYWKIVHWTKCTGQPLKERRWSGEGGLGWWWWRGLWWRWRCSVSVSLEKVPTFPGLQSDGCRMNNIC